MDISALIFYVLSALIVASAASVVLQSNPIYSALSLALTMVGLGFLYFHLEAYFIASVQLIVYAGAVMVLFVMVIMLFDLKKEKDAFSGGPMSAVFKILCGLMLTAGLALAVRKSVVGLKEAKALATPAEQVAGVKALATQLFTQYLFAFEALGVLLLIIAIGVVAVSRSRGGTHAAD